MEVNPKLNFSEPSYTLFVQNVYGSIKDSWSEIDSKYMTPTEWLNLMVKYGGVTWLDVVSALFLALFWTYLRKEVTLKLFQPLIDKSGLHHREAEKAPESAWKFCFYLCAWMYSMYILFFTNNNFFLDAPSTFYGWKALSPVPTEIYIAYMVQFSFYIHSVYGTLCMDVWRKDSVIMLMHHFVTMLLIGFSYVFRYTNVGILILFLHDITDILLEGTKLAVYYKTKGGYWYTICDLISTIGFILFGAAWYVFRLYWYPLKAMYAAGYVSKRVADDIVFYHFFNALLWILLAMNIYWFTFIVRMAYKVLTKQVTEVDDTREYSKKKVLDDGKKRN